MDHEEIQDNSESWLHSNIKYRSISACEMEKLWGQEYQENCRIRVEVEVESAARDKWKGIPIFDSKVLSVKLPASSSP